MSTLPAVTDCLPHRGAMVFLETILERGATHILCETSTEKMAIAADDSGAVGPAAGLELMAQAAAAYAGAQGGAPKRGMFLGTRRCEVHLRHFLPEQRLQVRAELDGSAAGLSTFDCAITDAKDGRLLMAARINVMVLDDNLDERS